MWRAISLLDVAAEIKCAHARVFPSCYSEVRIYACKRELQDYRWGESINELLTMVMGHVSVK